MGQNIVVQTTDATDCKTDSFEQLERYNPLEVIAMCELTGTSGPCTNVCPLYKHCYPTSSKNN